MNLVIVERHELNTSGDITLSDARAAHLRGVLHAVPGQTVRVGLLDGPRGRATVTSLDGGSVTMRCELEEAIPERPRVDILLAVPRPKVLRRIWAQIAALGVGRIILTNASRVERNYFDTHVLEPACYRPLLIEGLQQARDTHLPLVSIHRQFRILIEDHLDALSPDAVRLVADPDASMRIHDALGAQRGSRVLMAVGPEGGWNAFELSLLEKHGFQRVGMGPRTLRLDTACLALLAIVHDAIRM